MTSGLVAQALQKNTFSELTVITEFTGLFLILIATEIQALFQEFMNYFQNGNRWIKNWQKSGKLTNTEVQIERGEMRHRNKCQLPSHCQDWLYINIHLLYQYNKTLSLMNEKKKSWSYFRREEPYIQNNWQDQSKIYFI